MNALILAFRTAFGNMETMQWDPRFRYETSGMMVFHRGGVPWDSAPRPQRWHRCQMQSEIFWTSGRQISDGGRGWILNRLCRCACGAYKVGFLWRNKNSKGGEQYR